MKKGRKFIKKRKTIPNFAPNQVFNGSLNRCKVLRTIAYVLILVVVFTGATLTAFAAETDPYAVQTTAVSGGYETLTIDSSVLNGSTIYGDGDSEYSLDKDGGFYSSAWKNYGNLPDSGRITVGSVPYQFTWTGNSPYAGKDSIRLSSDSSVNTTSKTMVLKQYGVYDKIYILGTAAGFANSSSSLSFTVNLNYTDGTFSQTTYKLGDWYRDSAVDNEITLYKGLYRKDVKPDYDAFPNGYTVGGRGPNLQSMAIDCDQTKLLSSIKFTMNTQKETSGGTTYYLYSGIYAVTGKVSDSAPATPDLYEITDADITSNSFTAKWDSASNATKYYLDVATDSSFENMLTGYSNRDVENVTEYKVEGLTTGTTYYYRVRSANKAGQSLSSTVRTVVPRFKNLPSPELSYKNTAEVGGETYLQTVSWPAIESAVNYRWSIEIPDENGNVSTYTGDLNQAGADGSVYVVKDGSRYLLNFTNLVDSIGEYKVSIVAEPEENSDEYLSSDNALKTINIAFPNVTVDVTDELKASGIVSGIGGDCEKSITDGVLTLTAKNANEYSELGVWYKSSVVFDTGVRTSFTADEQYGDTYKLIFDINRNKLELSDDGNGKFTLKLLENIVLEQDLVFGKDIILDLNRNKITTNTNSTLEVKDVVLNVRNGHLTDAVGGTENIINTIGNGVVIVENSVVMNGLVGGDAEVSWNESNGDKHYATINDALTGGEGKKADDNSTLSLIKDKELTEDLIIPESIIIHVPDGNKLSVAENVMLTNKGTIVTDGEIINAGTIKNTEAAILKNEGVVVNTTTGEIYNEGSIDNNSGQIDNAGLFGGEGTIDNENGKITSVEGILQNQINNGPNGQIISEASWNDGGKKYYGPIDEAIESATNNTDEKVIIIIESDISIAENVTIPENVTLVIPADKTLTVPEGITLDNNGEIVEVGALQVSGDIESNASWTDGHTKHYSDLNTALDNVKSGESVTLLENFIWTYDAPLEIPQDVDFVIPNDVVLEIEKEKLVNVENIKSETLWKSDENSNKISFGSLEQAIEESTSNVDNNVDIIIRDDVVLEENITIPEGVNITISEGASLTVPDGKEIENNGTITNNGTLTNNGTIDNNGSISNAGVIDNVSGTEIGGELSGAGHIIADGGAFGHGMSEATCTEPSKCLKEGCTYTEGTALGHDMSEATCTEASKCQREGCNHTGETALGHDMSEATCTEASKCQRDGCNHIVGTALGHDMSEATCTEASKCQREVCNHTEGTALGHDMSEATCTEVSKCQREGCNHTVGTALGHDMSEATCTEVSKCQRDGCNHTVGTALGHDMSEATCTEASKCQRQGCNYTVGTSLGHDWSGEWTVVKEATKTEEGKKETLCLRGCGQKKVVVIPATGTTVDNDNFEKSVELESDNPIDEATLDNSEDELLNANKIFTTTEKQDIKNGADAKVWIEISDTDFSTISSDVKNKIEQKVSEVMGDNQNAIYFEADLFKQVGNGIVKEIREPGVAIKITIKIPTELINTDATITREYKLIRTHEGQNKVEVDIIEGTFDPATEEFMFKTDKFSTYAIVYTDTPVENKNDNGETDTDDVVKPDSNQKDEVPKTGGSNVAMYSFTLMFISGLGIVLISRKRKTYCKEN